MRKGSELLVGTNPILMIHRNRLVQGPNDSLSIPMAEPLSHTQQNIHNLLDTHTYACNVVCNAV